MAWGAYRSNLVRICENCGVSSDQRGGQKLRGLALRRVALIAPLSAAVIVAGCGSSAQKRQAQQLEAASILSPTSPLSERLVRQAEINSARSEEHTSELQSRS